MEDPTKGLLRNQAGHPGKFIVKRTDGRGGPGDKHDGCEYFVLDLTHDPHARVAARACAENCEAAGFDLLAEDLRALVARLEPR